MAAKKKLNSNPIPDTLETVPGYPASLKIYRVPCSSFYQMRCWMSGKMVTRSTKTRNKDIAKKTAGDFYNHLLLKRAKGEALTESSQFKTVYEGLLAEDKTRVQRGEIKQSSVDDLEYCYKQDLEPFFKRDQLAKITYSRIQEFVTKLLERDISSKTIKNKLIFLSKILEYSVKHNRLDKVPIFPEIQLEDNPRGWLDDGQYKHLIDTIIKEANDKVVIRYQPITRELVYLAGFMVDSFLRPPDIKVLKNKDITVFKENPNTYLRIQAKGKVKPATVVTMPLAVEIYEKLTALNAKLGYGKPDDYVFFPALTGREHAMKIIQLQFKHVLEKAGLKTAPDGKPRTLYSLRHTAIMFRLIEGDMDIFLLARNCRTSVEMIERFYGSHLAPEMKVAELQSFKRGHD